MNKEVIKQYFKHFMVLYIILAILIILLFGSIWVYLLKAIFVSGTNSRNQGTTSQRVFDYANRLTDDEEERLENIIEKTEKNIESDIILLLTNEYMGASDDEWYYCMRNRADDFYDAGQFGYNEPYGDGLVFLYNWYVDSDGTSHKGVWISTSGKMIDVITVNAENYILDEFEAVLAYDELRAYETAISCIENRALRYENNSQIKIPGFICIFAPVIIALIYMFLHMNGIKTKDTTTPYTYVMNRKPQLTDKRDEYLRKHVSYVIIQSSSSSGGSSGSSRGGSGGVHRSSSGRSHGGGGRRH